MRNGSVTMFGTLVSETDTTLTLHLREHGVKIISKELAEEDPTVEDGSRWLINTKYAKETGLVTVLGAKPPRKFKDHERTEAKKRASDLTGRTRDTIPKDLITDPIPPPLPKDPSLRKKPGPKPGSRRKIPTAL